MQITALNLIMAAQQARQATPQRAPSGPVEKTQAESDEFRPLSFGASEAAPSRPAISTDAPRPFAPPGSQIDISV